MSEQALLTDLCAICHVNTIKYTCPRCGIHTCSLPCVKKHKAWAQCSGIRNPAEYRKRSELATASSIDKDFNFISQVERSVARADQDVLQKGIHLAPARDLKPHDKRPKVDIAIEERKVTVIKAPKGLSRSKSNKTHWNTQHQCIMWTVEWMNVDDTKTYGPALETKTVGDAFVSTVGKKKIKRKRRLSQLDTPAQNMPNLAQIASPRDESTQALQGEADVASLADEHLLRGLYFYLHIPRTSSKFKCLRHINLDETVQAVLSGQTVLEYPTIYVRAHPPDDLQEPFITEQAYAQRHGEDIPVNLTAPLEDGEVDEGQVDSALTVNSMDSGKVLEVLAQDLAD